MPTAIGRRRVLQLGGLLLLSRLPALPVGAASVGGRVLSPADAAVLLVIGERMTRTGDAAMPRFGDTAALATIDRALQSVPAEVPQQLSWALWLFEWGPLLFNGQPSRFTRLAPEWQDAYLAGWADSRFHTRRVAFQAVKNLTMLGYYAEDATWPGIHYAGPMAPRPRRAGRTA